MSIEEKYLGTSLDYYLKSQEPQFLKLKTYINIYNYARGILFLVIIIFFIVIASKKDETIINRDLFALITLILLSVAIISWFLILFSKKKIKNVSMKLLSDYIGGMNPIKLRKFRHIESLVRKKLNIGFFSFDGVRITISDAFNVIEEDFSYDVYYVDAQDSQKCGKDYSKYSKYKGEEIRLFDGIVVLFKTLPENILQSVMSQKNDKIELMNKQMVYFSNKFNNNKFKLLTSTNINNIKTWAENNIIELVEMKEQIKKEIETMKKDVKEEYFF